MESNEDKLKSTVFFIEADSFSKHVLWKDNHKNCDWKEDTSGFHTKIGHIGKGNKRPVTVMFFFAKIYDQRICFYNATSRFVDHDMVEEYIKENWPVRYNNGSWAMCDAENFHLATNHCMSLKDNKTV